MPNKSKKPTKKNSNRGHEYRIFGADIKAIQTSIGDRLRHFPVGAKTQSKKTTKPKKKSPNKTPETSQDVKI